MLFHNFLAVGHAIIAKIKTEMATGHEPPQAEKPKPPMVPIA